MQNGSDARIATLEALLDNTAAVVYVKRIDGAYEYINRRFEELFGVTNDQLRGKTDFDVFPAELAESFRFNDQAVARGGKAIELEEVARHEDGDHTYVSLKLPLFAEDGTVWAVAGISTDITSRKEAEEALSQQAAALSVANADLQQFVYMATHDLKEPLRAITTWSGMLLERHGATMAAEAKKLAERSLAAADRMGTLVADLLDYSRAASSKLDLQPTSISDVMETVMDTLSARIEESGATVKFAAEQPAVQADARSLEHVLQNLVGNALTYRGEEAPVIEVSTRLLGDKIQVAVSDNGIGIEEKYQAQVFEAFKRLHSRRRYPGTGIGLAICRRYVARMGGTIGVQSEFGRGSTFWFILNAP